MQLSLTDIPVNNDPLGYWENEKQKALQRHAKKQRNARLIPACIISKLLPEWEQQKRQRLGEVQILLNN